MTVTTLFTTTSCSRKRTVKSEEHQVPPMQLLQYDVEQKTEGTVHGVVTSDMTSPLDPSVYTVIKMDGELEEEDNGLHTTKDDRCNAYKKTAENDRQRIDLILTSKEGDRVKNDKATKGDVGELLERYFITETANACDHLKSRMLSGDTEEESSISTNHSIKNDTKYDSTSWQSPSHYLETLPRENVILCNNKSNDPFTRTQEISENIDLDFDTFQNDMTFKEIESMTFSDESKSSVFTKQLADTSIKRSGMPIDMTVDAGSTHGDMLIHGFLDSSIEQDGAINGEDAGINDNKTIQVSEGHEDKPKSAGGKVDMSSKQMGESVAIVVDTVKINDMVSTGQLPDEFICGEFQSNKYTYSKSTVSLSEHCTSHRAPHQYDYQSQCVDILDNQIKKETNLSIEENVHLHLYTCSDYSTQNKDGAETKDEVPVVHEEEQDKYATLPMSEGRDCSCDVPDSARVNFDNIEHTAESMQTNLAKDKQNHVSFNDKRECVSDLFNTHETIQCNSDRQLSCQSDYNEGMLLREKNEKVHYGHVPSTSDQGVNVGSSEVEHPSTLNVQSLRDLCVTTLTNHIVRNDSSYTVFTTKIPDVALMSEYSNNTNVRSTVNNHFINKDSATEVSCNSTTKRSPIFRELTSSIPSNSSWDSYFTSSPLSCPTSLTNVLCGITGMCSPYTDNSAVPLYDINIPFIAHIRSTHFINAPFCPASTVYVDNSITQLHSHCETSKVNITTDHDNWFSSRVEKYCDTLVDFSIALDEPTRNESASFTDNINNTLEIDSTSLHPAATAMERTLPNFCHTLIDRNPCEHERDSTSGDHITSALDNAKTSSLKNKIPPNSKKRRRSNKKTNISLECRTGNIASKFAQTVSDLTLSEDLAIESNLTCSICYDVFYRPHQCRPCNHIFCEICLRKISSIRGSDNVPCPICRRTIMMCQLDLDLNRHISNMYPRQYMKRKNDEKFGKVRFTPLPFTHPPPKTSKYIRTMISRRFNNVQFPVDNVCRLFYHRYFIFGLFVFILIVFTNYFNTRT